MARLLHPPGGATRFFSRPLAAILECPRCGLVLSFNTGVGSRRGTKGWDSTTSRLKCYGCQMTFMIGLIAWPVRAGNRAATLPRDQVPEERQLAQMRSMGGLGNGWWMPREEAKPARRANDTNVTAKCGCWREEQHNFVWEKGCPLHGDDADQETEEIVGDTE